MKPALAAFCLLFLTGLLNVNTARAQDSVTSNLPGHDSVYGKVEVEAQYPGGSSAWLGYLNKNARYPDEAFNKNIKGTVVVQFIVDIEGTVRDVEAISGPDKGGLRQEAVRVIRGSGKWVPAMQHGQKVASYKKQPIVFKF